MRSAATIATGKVMVIVSPSAIFPLDGSITMPPASGLAFDTSSSSFSAALARARALGSRENPRPQIAKSRMTVQNRRFIGVLARALEFGEDPHPPHLSFLCGVRIVLVHSTQQTIR